MERPARRTPQVSARRTPPEWVLGIVPVSARLTPLVLGPRTAPASAHHQRRIMANLPRPRRTRLTTARRATPPANLTIPEPPAARRARSTTVQLVDQQIPTRRLGRRAARAAEAPPLAR